MNNTNKSTIPSKPTYRRGLGGSTASPLPYVIVFAILTVILLIAITWLIDLTYKKASCQNNPDIWCSNDFYCNNVCPQEATNILGTQYSSCFYDERATKPGFLHQCLFGPTSSVALGCFNPPDDGGIAKSCACPYPGAVGKPGNCFAGCELVPNISNCGTYIGKPS